MKELAQAIKDLMIEYEKACKLDFVIYPLSFALYQTWKKYDSLEKEKKLKEKTKCKQEQM